MKIMLILSVLIAFRLNCLGQQSLENPIIDKEVLHKLVESDISQVLSDSKPKLFRFAPFFPNKEKIEEIFSEKDKKSIEEQVKKPIIDKWEMKQFHDKKVRVVKRYSGCWGFFQKIIKCKESVLAYHPVHSSDSKTIVIFYNLCLKFKFIPESSCSGHYTVWHFENGEWRRIQSTLNNLT